jgi:hypothetical protein
MAAASAALTPMTSRFMMTSSATEDVGCLPC